MQEKLFFVYILTNILFGVFYIGVTSNLPKRIFEHRNKLIDGFSKRYNLTDWYIMKHARTQKRPFAEKNPLSAGLEDGKSMPLCNSIRSGKICTNLFVVSARFLGSRHKAGMTR